MALFEEKPQAESQPTAPQIDPQFLGELGLTQEDINAEHKHQEAMKEAEDALNKRDWKTAISKYDEVAQGGIGSPEAKEFRLKISAMFPKETEKNTRTEIAKFLQQKVNQRKTETQPAAPAQPLEIPTMESQPSPITQPLEKSIIEDPFPRSDQPEVKATPIAIPSPIETPKPITPVAKLAGSRPGIPSELTMPVLNISGDPAPNTLQNLRPAPPNPNIPQDKAA